MSAFGLHNLVPNLILRDVARRETVQVSSVGEHGYTARILLPAPKKMDPRVVMRCEKDLGITVRLANATERQAAGF